MVFIALYNSAVPCTNIIVSKAAAAGGAVLLSYNVDSPGHYYPFFFSQAKDHKQGAMFEIVEWTTGKYLGQIPEVPHTYKVIEHMNEFQVTITETTLGTIHHELIEPNGILDYGNLIYLGLLRSKTAREAIKVMTDLVAQYGWASNEPESFYIGDKNEAWIFEIYGKGKSEKGCIWVALRVPDGYICVHANKARIRTFNMKDKDNCMFAPDVISFAEKKGYYDKKRDGEFDLTNVYAPDQPLDLLACEGRVWSAFNMAAPSLKLSSKYFRAYKGEKPYPLFIKPDKKLTVQDVIAMSRDRFEGTEWDYSKLLIPQTFNTSIFKRPLVFNAIKGKDTVQCVWPRPIAVPQAAFVFVAQMRSDVIDELGVQWWAADDPKTSVFMPIYCGIESVPQCIAAGNEKSPDLKSAHWLFNLVANYSYFSGFYTIYPEIAKAVNEQETKFFANQLEIESQAMKIYQQDPKKAREFLTAYCEKQSSETMNRWNVLLLELMVKFRDGNMNFSDQIRVRAKGMGYPQFMNQKAFEENPDWFELKWK